MANDFRVLDASRAVVDEVNNAIARSGKRFLYASQLREALESITANIREGYGRRSGPERNQFFRHARGSAEEADEHLRANYAAKIVQSGTYWRAHNRLVVIRRMLTTLIGD
jgi:four helix bundle protein